MDRVYEFMRRRIPDVYTEVSGMHERFEILSGDVLVEGAEVECIEGGPKQLVHNHYVVTGTVENRLIQMESVPSVVLSRETGKKIGRSNAYVYLDFESLPGDRTRLSQTVVIDMLNPVFKLVADVRGLFSGDRKMWDAHFREELHGYRGAIERECATHRRHRPDDGEGP